MVPFQELDSVMLWVSHIMIRHEGSRSNGEQLRVEWAPDGPAPKRTKAEALSAAWEIAAALRTDSSRFEELAKRRSEDVATAAWGGSLGGMRAGQLPPDFLDALAVMRPGDASGVVETALGYHVIKRRAPPQEQDVSGQRIVIGYVGTTDGSAHTPRTRSREDANSLARTVLRLARNAPDNFSPLVRKYSEDTDRLRDEIRSRRTSYRVRDRAVRASGASTRQRRTVIARAGR